MHRSSPQHTSIICNDFLSEHTVQSAYLLRQFWQVVFKKPFAMQNAKGSHEWITSPTLISRRARNPFPLPSLTNLSIFTAIILSIISLTTSVHVLTYSSNVSMIQYVCIHASPPDTALRRFTKTKSATQNNTAQNVKHLYKLYIYILCNTTFIQTNIVHLIAQINTFTRLLYAQM